MKWSEFTWSMDDMIFLLEHLDSMKEGLSPFEVEELLIKPKGRRQPIAPFIPICELVADLELRLAKTNGDGVMLKLHYCQGNSIADIALVSGTDFYSVVRCMNRALRYISGRKPRRKSYEYWCHHGR